VKRHKIPEMTGDEVQDWFRHIKWLSTEDEAHCGYAYLPNRKMVGFWCDMQYPGKSVIMMRQIAKGDVPNKLVCHWMLDYFLDEWKTKTCACCKSRMEYRKKHCDCMQNRYVRRLANAIMRSFGKDKEI